MPYRADSELCTKEAAAQFDKTDRGIMKKKTLFYFDFSFDLLFPNESRCAFCGSYFDFINVIHSCAMLFKKISISMWCQVNRKVVFFFSYNTHNSWIDTKFWRLHTKLYTKNWYIEPRQQAIHNAVVDEKKKTIYVPNGWRRTKKKNTQ